MKKRALLFVLMLVLLLPSLVACGSKKESVDEDPYSDVELSKIVDFEGVDGVSVRYPEFMEYQALPNVDRTYLFYPSDQSNDNVYASILVSLVELDGLDEYMTKGSDLAEKANTYILANMINNTYGAAVSDYVGTVFEDGGSYWGLTGYLQMDGSQFDPATEEMVSSTAEVRYVGPTGYAVSVIVIALDKDITTYYNIAKDMIASVSLGGNWSTTPKQAVSYDQIPTENRVAPKKPVTTTKKTTKRRANEAPLADPFYWYDDEGDLWYFDGYDSVFIGFGDDYYLDDGELMESNDAGWDYDDDFVDPWSDAGDTYDGYGDYVDDDGYGDYVDDDGYGDYVDDDGYGDYVDDDGWGDSYDDYGDEW